jgi:hypothetical protein
LWLAILSGLTSLASPAVNIMSFTTQLNFSSGCYSLITILVLILFGFMVSNLYMARLTMIRERVSESKSFWGRYLEEGGDLRLRRLRQYRLLESLVPRGIKIVRNILVFYALLNFILLLFFTQESELTRVGGTLYLKIRALTVVEHLQDNYVERAVSAYWMVFALVTFIYFVFQDRKVREGIFLGK